MFKQLSVFLVSFISILTMAALPTKSEEVAGYFSTQFNRAENQKELIESFQLKKDQKNEIVDFLRKYRKEGLPVPQAKQKQSVLELKYNDGISSIDFEKYESSVYKIDGKVIQVVPADNVETIFKKLNPAKVSEQAPSPWIHSAEAAPLGVENKAAYAAVCLRVAEAQKANQALNSKGELEKKAKESPQPVPATR